MKTSFVSLLCGNKKLEKSSERRKSAKSSKKSCKCYSNLSFSFFDTLNVYITVQLKEICWSRCRGDHRNDQRDGTSLL